MTHPIRAGVSPVDERHQVVTLISQGPFEYCAQPCPECPWRTSNTGDFPPGAFVHSAVTAHDCSTALFSCHMRGRALRVCAGFLLRGATHNLAVRLRLRRGPLQVSGEPSDLHGDYVAMAVANGVSANHPALRACRRHPELESDTSGS